MSTENNRKSRTYDYFIQVNSDDKNIYYLIRFCLKVKKNPRYQDLIELLELKYCYCLPAKPSENVLIRPSPLKMF